MRAVQNAGLLFLALAGLANSARANLLLNGGLESTLPINQFGMIYASPTLNANALPSWTIGGPGTIDVVPSSYWHVGEGHFSVDLIGTPGLGFISQTVNGLTPGNAYELTFLLAINPDNASHEYTTTKQLQVSLTDSNSALIAPDTISSASAAITAIASAQTALFSGTATGNRQTMPYYLQTVDFTATTASVTLKFAALLPLILPANTTNVYCGPVIDNVSLIDLGGGGNIPEPASLSILGTGFLLLLRRRRA